MRVFIGNGNGGSFDSVVSALHPTAFGRGRVSHVGMITEILDDEIKFIHSSTQAGVIISSTKEEYYTRTFVQINRVLSE